MQRITYGFRAMLEAANNVIDTVSAAEAVALHGRDDVVFVDLRDPRELRREGRVPGAFHAPRGLLEFWIDPDSPYHKPIFAEDKRFVFFCATGFRPMRVAVSAASAERQPPAQKNRKRLSSAKTGLW